MDPESRTKAAWASAFESKWATKVEKREGLFLG